MICLVLEGQAAAWRRCLLGGGGEKTGDGGVREAMEGGKVGQEEEHRRLSREGKGEGRRTRKDLLRRVERV